MKPDDRIVIQSLPSPKGESEFERFTRRMELVLLRGDMVLDDELARRMHDALRDRGPMKGV